MNISNIRKFAGIFLKKATNEAEWSFDNWESPSNSEPSEPSEPSSPSKDNEKEYTEAQTLDESPDLEQVKATLLNVLNSIPNSFSKEDIKNALISSKKIDIINNTTRPLNGLKESINATNSGFLVFVNNIEGELNKLKTASITRGITKNSSSQELADLVSQIPELLNQRDGNIISFIKGLEKEVSRDVGDMLSFKQNFNVLNGQTLDEESEIYLRRLEKALNNLGIPTRAYNR